MPRAVPSPYVDTVPDYEIRDGVMHVTSGDWVLVMPLRIFEAGMRRARSVIDAHYETHGAVIPISRGRPKKG